MQTEVRHSHGQPSIPHPSYVFMDWLEQQGIATAPIDCKPKLWKRYVDDILEVIKKGKMEALTSQLNGMDKTNSISANSHTNQRKMANLVSGHPYHQEG